MWKSLPSEELADPVSVIAQRTQYTLAESSRTTCVEDTTKSEVLEDALWLGCGTMDKASGICDVGHQVPVHVQC